MAAKKVEMSKTSYSELEDLPSKFMIRCRDVVILCASFSFTIAVACFMILYINDNQCQNDLEIEKIVEKILIERDLQLSKTVERNFDEIKDEDVERSKRAINDYRVQKHVNTGGEGSVVEFFNPRLRPELEKNDTEIMKKSGLKGAAPKGDSWVWLTSYSRIPFEAIEGFCKKTKEYCPPGPAGSPGFPGQKGIKGDLGPEGPPGKSIRGGQGRPGPKGTRGEHGQRGLDGRDGVPGEPGLDGVPGRAGTDGKDGTNGIDGRKGERGKDGKDGIPGNVGPSGPRGPKGEKGLAGPQGRKGPSGKDGLNGTPGTCLYCMKRNESSPYDYWLPPQIPISSSNSKKIRPIIIREEDNLRIQCAATGYPKPTIVWEREDGRPIDWGKWKDNSKVGQSINITKINRVHMGTYICIADNAIPPVAEYKFKVEVHFKPTLRIRHKWDQAIQADFGAKITFKCESEGFPEPVLYWERADGVVIPNDSIKYRIESHTLDSYIFNTSLTINNVNQYDYGEYYCVGKNLHGIEKILFRLGTRGQWTRPFPGDGDKPVVSGETPPVLSYEDVCPPPEACPFCPTPKDLKCKDTSLSLKDLTGGKELEILPIENATYPELENRTQDCEVSVIGKPVFHNHLDMDHGAWLRDAIQQDNVTIEKIWLTKDTETNNLYEFKNRIDYRKNVPSRNQPYKLLCPFKGNAHIVYNANFYYFCADGPKIIRYDLKTERVAATRILDNINATQYLYTTQYNVIDFNADDNGLWIIHATPDSNYTIVSKINETTLETTNSFNISIHHHKVGEMFIVCGVLYAVDSATVRYTKIRFALDLYSKKLLDKELDFVNPFNSTTTIGYNHNKNELYTWNLGNQFTYRLSINAMGSNQTMNESFEKALDAVAHSVFRQNKSKN